MGNRGRKSRASYEVPCIDASRARVQPPAHLGETEAQRFVDLVASCHPQHFTESDVPLLCRFVEADLLAEQAAGELRDKGAVIDGKPNPWLVVQEKSVRALVALALRLRLRLSPQSRLDPKTVGRRENTGIRPPWMPND